MYGEIGVVMDLKYATITAWLPHHYKEGQVVNYDGVLWVVIGVRERLIMLRRMGWLHRLWWWARNGFGFAGFWSRVWNR